MNRGPRYVARGSVRGTCPHLHRSPAAAARCVARDVRACARLGSGAYSDRFVERTDGAPLDEHERAQVEAAQVAQ